MNRTAIEPDARRSPARGMRVAKLLAVLLLLSASSRPSVTELAAQNIRVGSKSDTENVILGEIATKVIQSEGLSAEHRAEIGGTRILWEALLAGDIDVYPEYTGTIVREILAAETGVLFDSVTGDSGGISIEDLAEVLAPYGVEITHPLGFNNTYVLGTRAETASQYNLKTITDLRSHPDLRFGFSNEFMARGDGWPSLKTAYGLNPSDVRGIDHDLGYRALENGSIDIIDAYSTDAEIAYYNLTLLRDDRHHFPEYQAVFLYRGDLERRAIDVLHTLVSAIPEAEMIRMNALAKIESVPEGVIAAGFLRSRGIDAVSARVETWTSRLLRNTLDHLFLVLISLIAAILIAIPLGVLAFRRPGAGRVILGVVGAIYTIPSLALLVFMIPVLGIGAGPAIVALFLYSLLPIVFNTHSGLVGIPTDLIESAHALGLDDRVRLMKVEIPMASRSILTGIRTAVVINIGTATLGALIGAGGYGQPILTGIRLNNTGLILEGAVPAALLALGVQYLLTVAERWIVPAGLRISD